MFCKSRGIILSWNLTALGGGRCFKAGELHLNVTALCSTWSGKRKDFRAALKAWWAPGVPSATDWSRNREGGCPGSLKKQEDPVHSPGRVPQTAKQGSLGVSRCKKQQSQLFQNNGNNDEMEKYARPWDLRHTLPRWRHAPQCRASLYKALGGTQARGSLPQRPRYGCSGIFQCHLFALLFLQN